MASANFLLAMGQNLTRGARLLREFIDTRRPGGLTQEAVAEALGVTPPAVHDWLDGRRRPNADLRVALATYTNNAVPAESWRTNAEAKEIAKVVPFEPASDSPAPELKRAAGGGR